MKINLKRGLLIVASLFLLSLPGQSIHAQKDMTSPIFSTEEDNKIDGVPDYGTCAEGDFDCMSDRNDSIQTADFIVKSFLSLDPDIAEQEMEQDYVKYYWNSSMTLMGDYLDLFRPTTILVSLINLVTNLFEMVGLVITTFVMILYNLTSTSFISSIMDSVLTALDQLIFQWDNPESWAYKIIIIGALVSFTIKMLSSRQKILSPSHFINMLFQVVLSASLIVVVGIYGRPLVNYVDKMFNDLIVVVIDNESERPLEIENKSILFDTLQMQSFKIRHFGSLDIEDTSYEDEEGELFYVSAEERLDTLLNEQTWESAWTEYDSYGNNAITHNVASSMQVLFLSILFLLHRVMLAIIYLTLCALLGIVKLLKELTIVLSLYQLIYLLFKGNSNNRRWFMDRLQWMVVCMIGNVLFTTLLFFMSRMIENVSMIHPLALIGFDVLLLLLIMAIPKLISPMMQSMKKTMTPQMISNVLSGRSSPQDVYRDLERNFDHKKKESRQEDEQHKLPSPQDPIQSNEQELADHAIAQYEDDPAKQLNDTFREVPIMVPKNSTTALDDKAQVNEPSIPTEVPIADMSSKNPAIKDAPTMQTPLASSSHDGNKQMNEAAPEKDFSKDDKEPFSTLDKQEQTTLPSSETMKQSVQTDPSKTEKQAASSGVDDLAEKHQEPLMKEFGSDQNTASKGQDHADVDLADHSPEIKDKNTSVTSDSLPPVGLEEKTEIVSKSADKLNETSHPDSGTEEAMDSIFSKESHEGSFKEEVDHKSLTEDNESSNEAMMDNSAPSSVIETKKEDSLHEIENESSKEVNFHEDN